MPNAARVAVKWVAGILAAAAATVLAGLLTGTVQDLLEPDEGKPEQVPFTTSTEVVDFNCESSWWVPHAPSEIAFEESIIVDPPQWPAYDLAEGGAPASTSSVILTVQGRTETAVVLTDLKVRVVERRPVPTGNVLDDPCGDVGTFRSMSVDLDAEPPRVEAEFDKDILDLYRENVPPAERRPIRFPYQVRASAPETFWIFASTADCDCDWVVDLSWQSGGRSGTEVIDDGGDPFRTVSEAGAAQRCTSSGDCTPITP
jgi:hypothetical protein